MNRKAVRITKIIGFTVPAAILALVITIEYFYHRGLSALPENPHPETNHYSQFLQDSSWVALGGEGDIKMYKVSPISFITRLVYAGLSQSPSHQFKVMHASEGLARVVSSTLILKNKEKLQKERKDIRQINYISAAIWVSNHWSARDGLDFALDTGYFGRQCFGIKAAAKNYFGKTPDTLTKPEALLLLALPKAPKRFDPVVHPKDALKQSNLLVEQLAKNWPDKYKSLGKIEKIPATLVKHARQCSLGK